MSQHLFRALPSWSSNLREIYWELRYWKGRSYGRTRTLYRHAKNERAALVRQGVDAESVRLLCRWLVQPSVELRLIRFWAHADLVATRVRLAILVASGSTGGMGAVAPHGDQCRESHSAGLRASCLSVHET